MQGKFVNEQELARDIGVSRTPVREALLLFIRLDQHFHQLLIDAAANQLISQTYDKLRARQVFIGVEALFRTHDRHGVVCDEHEIILQALRQGDVKSAESAIDDHLAVALNVVLRGT